MRLVSKTGSPSSRARAFTGEGSSFLPRERTASGRVSTRATSCFSASFSNDGTENDGVPINTTRMATSSCRRPGIISAGETSHVSLHRLRRVKRRAQKRPPRRCRSGSTVSHRSAPGDPLANNLRLRRAGFGLLRSFSPGNAPPLGQHYRSAPSNIPAAIRRLRRATAPSEKMPVRLNGFSSLRTLRPDCNHSAAPPGGVGLLSGRCLSCSGPELLPCEKWLRAHLLRGLRPHGGLLRSFSPGNRPGPRPSLASLGSAGARAGLGARRFRRVWRRGRGRPGSRAGRRCGRRGPGARTWSCRAGGRSRAGGIRRAGPARPRSA